MADLRIYLFGSPHIEFGGRILETDRNKAVALLAYLAVSEEKHSRDALAAMLWPEYEQSRAYAYLRRTLWELNNLLGEGWIEADRDSIGMSDERQYWLDVIEFEKLSHGCQEHAGVDRDLCSDCLHDFIEAIELYRGDFLAGFSLRDSPEFDGWQFFHSENFRQKMCALLGKLSECSLSAGDPASALEYSLRWLSLDNLNEGAHRQVMLAYAQAGQRGMALRQYQECERILAQELDVDPEPETKTLYDRIRRGLASGPVGKSVQAAITTTSQRQVRLPAQGTAFLGREEDLAKILLLLQDKECSLLTLVGPGGIGKSRLAVETGRRVYDHFEGVFNQGIYFISLAPLSSVDALVPTLAESLGYSFQVEEASGRSPESHYNQLLDFLREKEALLILDNFEHLMEGVNLLSDILAHAPGVKLLVTTRERLKLREEWVYDVRGLDYPEDGSVGTLGEYSAVQLFLQNVEKVRAGEWLAVEELSHVARICQLLEGVPLGLELAAAWAQTLSPHEIADEIERSLDFLVTPLRGVSERHHSLRAVFDHSWSLLSQEEQDVFSRLSVFRGAFSREAALFVADASLRVLSTLMDKSLLRRTSAGRYEMHELVKQYAAEKLFEATSGEKPTRDRHAHYFASQLAQVENELKGPEQLKALNDIERELEDIRAAWYWSVLHKKLDAFYRIGFVLYLYLSIRNRFQEGYEETRKVIQQLQSPTPDIPGRARQEAVAFTLGMQSAFLSGLERFEEIRSLHEQCLIVLDEVGFFNQEWEKQKSPTYLQYLPVMISFGGWISDRDAIDELYRRTILGFEKTGNDWGLGLATYQYGIVARYEYQDMKQAQEMLSESYRLFRKCGNPWGIALSLNGLSRTSLLEGDYQAVIRIAQESQEIYDEMGDRWHMIDNYFALGMASVALGAYEQAKEYYQGALSLASELGSRLVVSSIYDSLGYADFLLKDYTAAEEAYRQSLAVSRKVGNEHAQGMALNNLADVLRVRGDWETAREYYQQGILMLEEEGDLWEQAMLWKKLGIVYRELGDSSEAGECFSKALQMADKGSAIPETLNILIEIALLKCIKSEKEHAVEILALCRGHPALALDAKVVCEQELDKIAAEMSAEAYESALQQGKNRKLRQVVADILSEAQPADSSTGA